MFEYTSLSSKDEKILFGSLFTIVFLMMILMLFIVITSMIRLGSSQEYVTDNIVECNDVDGDLIKDLICYDKVTCSNKLKFLNEPGCEEFVG